MSLSTILADGSALKTLVSTGKITEADAANVYDEITSAAYSAFPNEFTREARSLAIAETARLSWLTANPLTAVVAAAPIPTAA